MWLAIKVELTVSEILQVLVSGMTFGVAVSIIIVWLIKTGRI